MQILKNHVSPESAFVVNDYPYGFRLRCKIAYWLEHQPKLGTRLVSQTTNPKRPVETWNKAKKSTYQYVAGCMFLDEENLVAWIGLNEFSSLDECKAWLETYREGLTPEVIKRVENWIGKKEAYEQYKQEIAANLAEKLCPH